MGKLRTHVRLMNMYGWEDSLAENEVGFLDQFLPLFQVSDGVPRAQVDVVRVGDQRRFRKWLFTGDAEVIHLSSHGTRRSMKVGPENLTVRQFRGWVKEEAEEGWDLGGAVVLNTSCEMASQAWREAFLEAGALAYIATKRQVWAKDAAIFSAAFYSAYFGSIHKGKDSAQRAYDAYRLAHAAYRSFVPSTATAAKFYWASNEKVSGSKILPAVKL
ncbi:MAG: hypothetical protein U0P45_03415 [Acidimicrobiales bacterium]